VLHKYITNKTLNRYLWYYLILKAVFCAKNYFLQLNNYIFMRIFIIIIAILSLLSLNACGPLKYKKVSAKDFPPDPKERIKKNMEEGRGFRILGDNKKGTNYEFASSNPLWRATLDTLNFMPLVSANYSGGIVITDWYSENSPTESIKITVRFLTNEIRSDAIKITIHKKICNSMNNCKTNIVENSTNNEIKIAILKRAAQLKKIDFAKTKEENSDVNLPKNF